MLAARRAPASVLGRRAGRRPGPQVEIMRPRPWSALLVRAVWLAAPQTVSRMIRSYLPWSFLYFSRTIRKMMVLRMAFLTRMRILKCVSAVLPLVGGRILAGLAHGGDQDGTCRRTYLPVKRKKKPSVPGSAFVLTFMFRLAVFRSETCECPDAKLPTLDHPR